MQKWTDKPSDIPDIGHEYLTYIRSYLDHSERDSSLCLAVSAISLVIFGRLKGFSQAIVEADRYYTRVISKTQSDIRNLDKVDVDELMLATMLMTHYEVRFWVEDKVFN